MAASHEARLIVAGKMSIIQTNEKMEIEHRI